MLFKDEQTGIEIQATVMETMNEVVVKGLKSKLGKDGKTRLIKTKGKKMLTTISAQVGISQELGDEVEMVFNAMAKQHPNDIYNQLQGKRLVFSKILKKIMGLDNDNTPDILYNTKKIRTAVWRIGEVFAGVRDKSTVFIDLPS